MDCNGVLNMKIFYSAKNNGFFPDELKSIYTSSDSGWPADAIKITQSEYNKLMQGRDDGKVIASDSNGSLFLSDPPAPSQEDLTATAEEQRNALMTRATEKIAPLQDAVDLDDATDAEKARLIGWKKYRVLLNRVDVTKAPDINWPDSPNL